MPMRLQISPRIWFILLHLIERRRNTAACLFSLVGMVRIRQPEPAIHSSCPVTEFASYDRRCCQCQFSYPLLACGCGGSCELRSGMLFELLASLLSSWPYMRTSGARAKLPPCGNTLTPDVL